VELLLAPISPHIKAAIHYAATCLETEKAQTPLLAFDRARGTSTPRKEEGHIRSPLPATLQVGRNTATSAVFDVLWPDTLVIVYTKI